MGQENRTRMRPLRARPGARFACFGDGLCCTDVHAIGPIDADEGQMLQLISPEVVTNDPLVEADVLVTGRDGRCLFLGEGGCALHAALGPAGKPHGCRLYPYGLTATVTGGRITTEHRCPCRTMGDRPALSVESAEEALRQPNGRLRPHVRAPSRISVHRDRWVTFAEWEEREADLLRRLAAGDDPHAVLQLDAFADLDDGSWEQVATEMTCTAEDGAQARGYETRFEAALACFGETMLEMLTGEEADEPPRPWADAFDRAEARARREQPAWQVWADWVADELWALRWARLHGYGGLRVELGTRLVVAQRAAAALEQRGVRADRAAAESVMVAELVGVSDLWSEVVRRMRC